jgi:hypothetical protein
MGFPIRPRPLLAPLTLLAAGLLAGSATAVVAAQNTIRTNEAYVEEVLRAPDYDIRSIDEVFDYVFASLGDAVTVYPTENYYYFKFVHGGVPYAGNFRLDIADRDQGVVHFAYFSENNPFVEQEISEHRAYTAEFGVTVEKKDALAYAITAKGRTVLFRLNDLRQVKPPEAMLAPGETYVGPVFDESGVRMFLIWNQATETFHYVLDEAVVSETYFQSSASSQVRIGRRTHFAWYKDRYRERWILVGVRAAETSLNTFFDGPFDQLPDNFIEGDVLRNALLTLSPEVEGQIDRLGNSLDLKGRMLVDPYILYDDEAELAAFDQCTAAAVDEASYYPCLAVGQSK